MVFFTVNVKVVGAVIVAEAISEVAFEIITAGDALQLYVVPALVLDPVPSSVISVGVALHIIFGLVLATTFVDGGIFKVTHLLSEIQLLESVIAMQ